jgi:D-sedoheptulose 7-phosphate isomerase
VSILEEIVGARSQASEELAGRSLEVAGTCRDMAERFAQGGRLIVLGSDRTASDAEHVAVEFVHPVIVGKRALPALALTGRPASQIELLGSAADIAMGISAGDGDESVRSGLEEAAHLGMLTVALTGGSEPPPSGVDHCIRCSSPDALTVKEAQVTTYHVIWELVHVFLERSGGVKP